MERISEYAFDFRAYFVVLTTAWAVDLIWVDVEDKATALLYETADLGRARHAPDAAGHDYLFCARASL